MKQLALLMSGGVDSSVAACLLREQGYMVTGIHMKLFTFGPTEKKEESWEKVKEVSRKLGIPCHLLDLSDIFKKKVVDSFIDSYRLGITPNPCVVCNKTIKFGAFFEYARSELKVDYISSGHYARIVQKHDLLGLAKAVDTKKDQSYFLYQLSQPILQNLLLPLGSLTKPEVRILAQKFSLSTDFGKESEDVCFFPGDFKSFIANFIEDQPGNVTDKSGKILGRHKGIHYYTVGQRQGLGLSSSEPLYIVELNCTKNEIVVGTREDVYSKEVILSTVHWISGAKPHHEAVLKAKVRYRGEEKRCSIESNGPVFRVTFDEPQFAITKGQSIVFYESEQVLGGGVIDGNTNFSS
jgi:tRNA-specific 2-thiouridylase